MSGHAAEMQCAWLDPFSRGRLEAAGALRRNAHFLGGVAVGSGRRV